MLPRLNGFELCRQIREIDSQTPIVFYSGAAYEKDKQQGIAAGANAYVIKPEVDSLIKTLRRLIAKTKVDDVAVSQSYRDHRPFQNSFPAQFFSVKTAGN